MLSSSLNAIISSTTPNFQRLVFEVSASDKEYKIMLCGDSISKGVTYDEDRKKYITLSDNFASIVQSKLDATIYNCGKFGNTLVRGISRIGKDLFKFQPNIVVVEFGGNDCDFKWDEVAANPKEKHQPATDCDKFYDLLKNLVESLQKKNIVPVLLTIPPIDAERYFNWISKNSVAIGDKITSWLGSVSKIYWWQERYNSAITSVAIECHINCIDTREAFLRTPDFRRLICADGIHPNEEGHRVIASKIIDYINSNFSFLLKK